MNTLPDRMTAFRIARFGGPEVLTPEQVALPQPGDGEVLVKVRAASVNPVDWKIREGHYPVVKEDRLPYTLGRDLCGTVVALGRGVRGLEAGQTLIAMLGIDHGAYADYALVRLEEAAPCPHGVDAAHCAALPLAGLTAWQGLFMHGGLQAGQTVLVHAAAGGVGHFAVQFAKAHGARVVATASAAHADFVHGLGADQVIDHENERFEDRVRDVDLVYDLVGGQTQERSWSVLRRGGSLVSTLTQPSQERAAELGVRALRYTAEPNAPELGEIARLVELGKVRPHVSRTFALRDAPAALREVEGGHTVGKVVLVAEG